MMNPRIDTDLSFNNIATLRARAGFALDNTLLYVTGGLAAVDMEFGAVMVQPPQSDSQWVYGWTAGGGLEHAFTQNFSGRIEYLYVDLHDTDFSMTDRREHTLTPPSRSTTSTWSVPA